MSGGSFDYAYTKVDELRNWAETLEQMAVRCEQWAGADSCTRWDEASRKHVPATLGERAHVMVRALLLRDAAKDVRKVFEKVERLSGILHDVEWVASGDYGPDALMGDLP